MFGSNTIEIIIGIVLVFILVSTICTAIREGIEAKRKTRAAYLEQGIREMLNDRSGTELAKEIYSHPLIAGLFNGDYKPGANVNGKNKTPDWLAAGGNLPSYIPSKNFARAFLDLAARGNVDRVDQLSEPITIETVRKNVANLGNAKIERLLLSAVDMAQGNILQVEENIQNWFDSGMDRVSGWYKRSTQYLIFIIGLAVAVVMNVNVFRIVDYLSKNDTARKILVEKAVVLSKDSTATSMSYKDAQDNLKNLKLPIGWTDRNAFKLDYREDGVWNNLLGPVLGWLITAFAATLGAPYWFDVLNKVMVIRSTVKPHEKSGEEAAQDNQEKGLKVVNTNAVPVIGNETVPEDEVDCCNIEFVDETPDKDLPVSKGGVAL